MHLAEDPLGPQNIYGTRISKAKVSAPAPIKKAPQAPVSKGRALKNKIQGVINKVTPGRKFTVDNANDPASAHSMIMRKTESKKPANFGNLRANPSGPSLEVLKKAQSYRSK